MSGAIGPLGNGRYRTADGIEFAVMDVAAVEIATDTDALPKEEQIAMAQARLAEVGAAPEWKAVAPGRPVLFLDGKWHYPVVIRRPSKP